MSRPRPDASRNPGMVLSLAVPRNFAANLLAAIAVALWAALSTRGWAALLSCFFGWCLLALAVSDIHHFRLPDYLTLPLVPVGLIASLFLDRADFQGHLLGCLGGFIAFLAIAEGYRWLRRRDGLGFGDIKLIAALGAWLGWQGLPSAVLVAALSGLLVVIVQAAAGRGASFDRPLPFGAFLSLGAWLVWLYGPLALG